MKVALIHEWLTTYAGSDKVLAEMASIFPEADIFCLIDFLSENNRGNFKGASIKPSFLQKIPFSRKYYTYMLPLMPLAIEQHDLSKYDLIISNCHAVAKGVITTRRQLHICYCYTPMRYAWDLQNQYIQESGFGPIRRALARYYLHKIRIWDQRTSNGVDHYIACSKYIAGRIWKTYRRNSDVIYPNVDTDRYNLSDVAREDFYVTASRMVPYKQMHLIVEAFTKMPHKRLVVIGDGPKYRYAKSIATPNITILGFQPNDVLQDHLRRCRAFIFASEEDFGIAPLEAQACGAPVIAFGRGGARETVVDGVTGLHFHEQTTESIIDAVARFETMDHGFDRQAIRAHAENFSTAVFREKFKRYVSEKLAEHQSFLINEDSLV
ncbi:Glycosyltransferase involved in cell wall bisynthesis [Methylobacterium phyllostachyos]|uniref:Glycosyltransferase involved in cell wall bisynthesis n=1 Tax=Methylobacterium phyllostachyos TaxID=582672 RepID=A0A1H0I568_9HYPH|nr:glycosyltransferase family 4 protein [Methylobacterium phyllostachyos]SDO26588.1 Glycosyltransferase involved in cell wall bisynthesis [Methylobacterium phyllostachyos]